MNTSTRLRRTLVPAVVALLAGGLLTACNPDQVGSAAIVDGKSISSDSLQHATRDYLKAVGNTDDTQAQRRILERMVFSLVVRRAAKDLGVGVSTGTVARQRDQVVKSVGSKVGVVRALAQQQTPTAIAPSQLDSWVRDRLLTNKILATVDPGGDPTSAVAQSKASAAIVKAARSMDITMNPRYGTFSPTRGVQPLISGGLSKTAAQLTES
jgi:hypothetical protein